MRYTFLSIVLLVELLHIHAAGSVWEIQYKSNEEQIVTAYLKSPRFIFDLDREFNAEKFDPNTGTVYLSPLRLGGY